MHAKRVKQCNHNITWQNAVKRFFRDFGFPRKPKHKQEDDGDRNDSPWAIVAGYVKQFNCSFDYAIYEVSMANIQLYSAVIPAYISKEEREGETVDMDDPRNSFILDNLIKNQ